jgi:hypothetical protein
MTFVVTLDGVTVIDRQSVHIPCIFPDCQAWIDVTWLGLGIGSRDNAGGLRTSQGWVCHKHVVLSQVLHEMFGLGSLA